MSAGLDRMLPTDGGRISAVIFMMVGEKDSLQSFALEQLNKGFLHMALAAIDDKSIEDINVYRHEGPANRAIAELDRLRFQVSVSR